MASTFETLPDEIIMIVVRYSGNAFSILRTYLGLNERLNQILLDKRLHILADFLHINLRHGSVDHYYDSRLFREVSQKLTSMKDAITKRLLRPYFRSLVVFHIEERYAAAGEEFRLTTRNIQIVRSSFTDEQLAVANRELKRIFNGSLSRRDIRYIESLILGRGARLECPDQYIYEDLNLAKALNKLFFTHIDNARPISQTRLDSLVHLFKLLILSNPNLLNNRADMGGGGVTVDYFLFLAIFQLQCIHALTANVSLNMNCYRAVIDLALFIFQCPKQMIAEHDWCQLTMLEMLSKLVDAKTSSVDDEVFLQTSQLETLKILLNEGIVQACVYEELLSNTIERTLWQLIKTNRLDLILLICEHYECVQQIVGNPDQNRVFVNKMTKDRIGRDILQILMEKKIFPSWFIDRHFVFALLRKKERRLLDKLLTSTSSLIAQLDEDGNDLLLHLCLKVRGCRHRLVELLLRVGCDRQRRNRKGENFLDAIQLSRNRKLFNVLIERKVIKSSDVGGERQPM